MRDATEAGNLSLQSLDMLPENEPLAFKYLVHRRAHFIADACILCL